jgi:hypothetical protein
MCGSRGAKLAKLTTYSINIGSQSMSKFEIGKLYQLRNKEAVVQIVALDLTDEFKGAKQSVGGVARYLDGSSELMTWTAHGRFSPRISESGLDLLPTPISGDVQAAG